ncbi:hypothetical protein DEO72_LG8g1294 [Vigna unguiculata]|uniref:Uncharacterized protein n=1 Tax=Vigna unguiculata TaxID=3917 RepID=A0A4D6MP15_VIGUN|nr:hypothetical protein DEO72_LG8g1294 [Vigna unguiculata]
MKDPMISLSPHLRINNITLIIICFRMINHTIIAKHKQKRIDDAHMNLAACGPASTNLPACSLGLRTSLLVVLLYGPTVRPWKN